MAARSQYAADLKLALRLRLRRGPLDQATAEAIAAALDAAAQAWSEASEVGQTTVAKFMAKRRRPPSRGWKTFLVAASRPRSLFMVSAANPTLMRSR